MGAIRCESLYFCNCTQFGLDHCQAGELLSKSWHFPNELQQVITHHLEAPVGQGLLSLAQTACRLAANLNFPAVGHQDHHTKPSDTIDAYVPTAIRGRIVESIEHVDKQILDRLESLDF